MVHLSEETSNQVFEILADWEAVLKEIDNESDESMWLTLS